MWKLLLNIDLFMLYRLISSIEMKCSPISPKCIKTKQKKKKLIGHNDSGNN